MIIIVQPWFAAVGHPAQSLLNTAKVIGKTNKVYYLISGIADDKIISPIANLLRNYGNVIDFLVKTSSLKEGTLKAILYLRNFLKSSSNIDYILFFDANLFLLSCMWWLICFRRYPIEFGVIYLHGPELVKSRAFLYRFLVKSFISNSKVTFFLRTDELVEDWKLYIPNAQIRRLPTMEIPENDDFILDDIESSTLLKFGILGQVREGKGLQWIVPIFKQNITLGTLTVAGEFANDQQRHALSFLYDFNGFQNKFFSEQELLNLAVSQDYLLMLYDDWDSRLEGAVMFLAARVNRPVISYNEGWCGRMIATYKNGVAISRSCNLIDIIDKLPKPDTTEYMLLQQGVEAFKNAHSGKRVRQDFLEAIKVTDI